MYLLTIYSESDAFVYRVHTIKEAVYVIENFVFQKNSWFKFNQSEVKI